MHKFAVLVALAAVSLAAQIPLPPAPQKYVTDAAGVLDDDREHALNEKLAEYERRTTNQVIVYVDRRVPEGTTLEEMGAEAIRAWGVGQAEVDNGAVLFLFIDDRESRLEVGYGLEGVLTDALSKRILVDMRPQLREADYIGAVEGGVQAIFDAIASPQVEPQPVMPSQPEPAPARNFGPAIAGLFVLFLLVIIIKLLKDSRSFIQPNMTTFPPDHSPRDPWPRFESSPDSSSSSSSSRDSSSSSSPSSSSSSDLPAAEAAEGEAARATSGDHS